MAQLFALIINTIAAVLFFFFYKAGRMVHRIKADFLPRKLRGNARWMSRYCCCLFHTNEIPRRFYSPTEDRMKSYAFHSRPTLPHSLFARYISLFLSFFKQVPCKCQTYLAINALLIGTFSAKLANPIQITHHFLFVYLFVCLNKTSDENMLRTKVAYKL